VDRRARAACRERIERLRHQPGINVTVSVRPAWNADGAGGGDHPSGSYAAVGSLATSASPSRGRAGSGRRGRPSSARDKKPSSRPVLRPC